jgi:hypothetical protein
MGLARCLGAGRVLASMQGARLISPGFGTSLQLELFVG